MADVTVFVDTAVFGALPPICVKDGVHTADRLTISSEVSSSTGLGVAWLLILLGPLGWLGLFVILARGSSDVLTVCLPFSEIAYQRHRAARRTQHALLIGTLVLTVLAVIAGRTVHPSGMFAEAALGCCAIAAFLAGLLEWRRADSLTVGVRLDGSRRWVTLSRVHPDFASAVGGPATWSTPRQVMPRAW